jgi:hypothetical protein
MSSPRGFGLPHLSEDAVAAFADGVLSAAAASRARRHCAECRECADAVRIQREAAMMLRAAQAPSLPSGLLDRLAGLPMSTPLPPPRGGLPTVLGADGVPMFVAHDPRNADFRNADFRNADPRSADPRSADPGNADFRSADPSSDPANAGHPNPDPGNATGGSNDPGQSPQGGRPAPRRGAVPVTLLASAAAVVAAGTFGGHVSTLAADASLRAPAVAANAAGALSGTPAPTAGLSDAVLAGAGLLRMGSFTTSQAPTGRARVPAPRSSSRLVTSVRVDSVFRTAGRAGSQAGSKPANSQPARAHGISTATP